MLRALSEEEEQKSQKMKDKMDRLTDEIMTLREAISSSEEAMSADDMAFLRVGKNVKNIFFFLIVLIKRNIIFLLLKM